MPTLKANNIATTKNSNDNAKCLILLGSRGQKPGKTGFGVELGLTEAIAKLAEREPDKAVVFLNYSAMDPTLTNERCNFWHFRFYPSSEMKMEALTTPKPTKANQNQQATPWTA